MTLQNALEREKLIKRALILEADDLLYRGVCDTPSSAISVAGDVVREAVGAIIYHYWDELIAEMEVAVMETKNDDNI